MEHQPRLPQPGETSAELDHQAQLSRAQDPIRGQSGDLGRRRERRREVHRGGRRDHSQRRSHRLASHPDAVRCRTRRPPWELRDTGRSRSSGRRPEHAGPPGGVGHVADERGVPSGRSGSAQPADAPLHRDGLTPPERYEDQHELVCVRADRPGGRPNEAARYSNGGGAGPGRRVGRAAPNLRRPERPAVRGLQLPPGAHRPRASARGHATLPKARGARGV